MVRRTKQKHAIQAAFEGTDRPLSIPEVHAIASAQVSQLSIATVYRNIRLLLKEQYLCRVGMPGHTDRYVIAGRMHHDHFKCDHCGRLYELERCLLGLQPALPGGFTLDRHQIFFYGCCSTCGIRNTSTKLPL